MMHQAHLLLSLQDYLLEEEWTIRLEKHFLSAVDLLKPEEEEEKSQQLYNSFQLYEKLFEERLSDFY